MLQSQAAVCHTVRASVEFLVRVEWHVKLGVVVWKVPSYEAAMLGPSVGNCSQQCCGKSPTHVRWVGLGCGTSPSTILISAKER